MWCCVGVSGLDGASRRQNKTKDESRVHSCVIACKPLFLFTVNTLMPIMLSIFPSRYCDSSLLPCASFKVCVEACTYTQDLFSKHAGTSKLHFKDNTTCILTHITTWIISILIPYILCIVLTLWCEAFEAWAGTRKDLCLENTWQWCIHAAILASSKSPNQRPWGHNRLSTCSAMDQSLYLSSTSIVCIWICSRC